MSHWPAPRSSIDSFSCLNASDRSSTCFLVSSITPLKVSISSAESSRTTANEEMTPTTAPIAANSSPYGLASAAILNATCAAVASPVARAYACCATVVIACLAASTPCMNALCFCRAFWIVVSEFVTAIAACSLAITSTSFPISMPSNLPAPVSPWKPAVATLIPCAIWSNMRVSLAALLMDMFTSSIASRISPARSVIWAIL